MICNKKRIRRCAHSLAAFVAASVALSIPALASDPHPPQLTASVISEPAPIGQDGSTKLFYEMVLTNFVNTRYVINSIEARAGEARMRFDAAALNNMMQRFDERGAKSPSSDPRTLEGGRERGGVLRSSISARRTPGTRSSTGCMCLTTREKRMKSRSTPWRCRGRARFAVAPPLRGAWIAGDSANNGKDAAHRRAILVVDGRAWLAQRYAIDWVQTRSVNGKLSTWRGPENKNDSYFCYGQPIYSVADGSVVAATDGMTENVPHSGAYAAPIDFDNAGGNHVVVQIAPRRYAFYAHMRPGTVKVRVGEIVHVGDPIGNVGNTGSSAEPHLHFHIDDEPSFLAGNGMPYVFTQGPRQRPGEGRREFADCDKLRRRSGRNGRSSTSILRTTRS